MVTVWHYPAKSHDAKQRSCSVPRAIVWHHEALSLMLNSDPRDRFVYPIHKLMLDSYNLVNYCGRTDRFVSNLVRNKQDVFFSQLAWLHKYLMMFLHFEVGSTDLTENPACVVLVLGEIREIVDGALTVVL